MWPVHVASSCISARTLLECRIVSHHGRECSLIDSGALLEQERIRINGVPISEERFAECFWWCHDRLQHEPVRSFQMLTLMALKIFQDEAVDASVIEVGIGGRFDSTNVFAKPVAVAVTSLGFDHVEILGHSLREIAHEKAGIFKPGVPAFTSTAQYDEAMLELERVGQSVGCEVATVAPLQAPVHLGIAGEHQRQNASLALALVRQWMLVHKATESETERDRRRTKLLDMRSVSACEQRALENVHWPGRSHVIDLARESAGELPLRLYLDGAHTNESLACAMQWFIGECANQRRKNVLVFGCLAPREPEQLIQGLVRGAGGSSQLARLFDVVIATTTDEAESGDGELMMQARIQAAWLRHVSCSENRELCSSVSMAEVLERATRFAHAQDDPKLGGVNVFVTGSLHLVGNLLRHIGERYPQVVASELGL